EHLLIDNTRGGRAGDRLPIDENAARAVRFLDHGNRGVVALAVVEQMTRFFYRRLRVDTSRRQSPGQHNRSSSNDTDERTGEDRRARRQTPGDKADNKSGENEDAERRLDAESGDQDETGKEGTGDTAQRVGSVDAADPRAAPVPARVSYPRDEQRQRHAHEDPRQEDRGRGQGEFPREHRRRPG